MGKTTGGPVLACDPQALTPAQREHRRLLLTELVNAYRDLRELPDGVALGFQRDLIPHEKIEQWITYEAICCPFLTLTCADDGDDGLMWLKATGGPGVKSFLAATLGLWEALSLP